MGDPMRYWSHALQLGFLAAEAQAVIGMRLMGMAGFWSVTPSEDKRMISEKIEAMTRSNTQATIAILSGKPPDFIAAAALRPYRQKTRANARRLTKRGPKAGR